MWTDYLIFATGLLAPVFVVGVSKFFVFRNEALESQSHYQGEFYKAANAIVGDLDDTPEGVLFFFECLSRYLLSKTFLFIFVLSEASKPVRAKPSKEALSTVWAEIQTLRPELIEQYDRALRSFVMANSYSIPLLGAFIRYRFKDLLDFPAMTEAVASAQKLRAGDDPCAPNHNHTPMAV